MRQLATIRTISDIRPIDGADSIVVAQVDGWECVVRKEEGFQIGNKIVYIEIDSVVPERPEFEFLRDRKFRVRTIKLKGQVSQGLVLPLSILPSGEYEVGDDVTDILGVTKYDPQAQAEAQLLKEQTTKKDSKFYRFMCRFKWFRKLFGTKRQKKGYPDWIVKTDEERIQNKVAMFEKERDAVTPFMVTEKVDGQSATYFMQKLKRGKYEFGVCSRNIRLGKPDNSSYWKIALKYNMESVLRELIGPNERIVLQGEIIGQNIQKNKYDRKDYDFFAFNLIYPNRKCDTLEMAQLLEPFGIKTVPVVDKEKYLPATIDELVEYAKGKSVVPGGKKREGVVMRAIGKDISFKVINPDFLLAYAD